MQAIGGKRDARGDSGASGSSGVQSLRQRREPEIEDWRRALAALGVAYDKVAAALGDRMRQAIDGLEATPTLDNRLGWASDRRCLVETFLQADPVVIAYVRRDMARPDQIRALAEAAGELAAEGHSLFSALGLLAYIEQELGWIAMARPALGNA